MDELSKGWKAMRIMGFDVVTNTDIPDGVLMVNPAGHAAMVRAIEEGNDPPSWLKQVERAFNRDEKVMSIEEALDRLVALSNRNRTPEQESEYHTLRRFFLGQAS